MIPQHSFFVVKNESNNLLISATSVIALVAFDYNGQLYRKCR